MFDHLRRRTGVGDARAVDGSQLGPRIEQRVVGRPFGFVRVGKWSWMVLVVRAEVRVEC